MILRSNGLTIAGRFYILKYLKDRKHLSIVLQHNIIVYFYFFILFGALVSKNKNITGLRLLNGCVHHFSYHSF